MVPASTNLVLMGRLEAVPLADALQILAAARRDGILSVEREDPPESGVIELAFGRVVRAEVSQRGPAVGRALLRRRAVEPDTLDEALRRQSAAIPWRPLGVVLQEMGAVAGPALNEMLAEQMEEHAAEMLAWERGVFRFRSAPPAARGRDARPGAGLDARQLLLVAARRADDRAAAR